MPKPFKFRSEMKSIEEKAVWDPVTRRWKCKGEGCSQEFGAEQRQLMHNHWNRSHSGKTFDCEYCERSFGEGTNLKRHVKALHTVPLPSVSNMEQCSSCLWAWLHVSEHWKSCPMPNGRDGEPRAGWEWNDDLGRCVRIEREADSCHDTAKNRRSESPRRDEEEEAERSRTPLHREPQRQPRHSIDTSLWPRLSFPTCDSPRPVPRPLAQSASSQPFHHFETSLTTLLPQDHSVLEPPSLGRLHQNDLDPTPDSRQRIDNAAFAFPSEFDPRQSSQSMQSFSAYPQDHVRAFQSPHIVNNQHRTHDLPLDPFLRIDPQLYLDPYLLEHPLPHPVTQASTLQQLHDISPYYRTLAHADPPQIPPPPPPEHRNPSFSPLQHHSHHITYDTIDHGRPHGYSIPIDPRWTGDGSQDLEDSQPRYSLGKARIPLTRRQAVRYHDLTL